MGGVPQQGRSAGATSRGRRGRRWPASFLPRRFTIAYVRGIYEVIWGEPLDPGNFQRKMTEVFDRVENESVRPTSGRGRPASLFTRKQRATRDGFDLTPIEPPFRRKQ